MNQREYYSYVSRVSGSGETEAEVMATYGWGATYIAQDNAGNLYTTDINSGENIYKVNKSTAADTFYLTGLTGAYFLGNNNTHLFYADTSGTHKVPFDTGISALITGAVVGPMCTVGDTIYMLDNATDTLYSNSISTPGTDVLIGTDGSINAANSITTDGTYIYTTTNGGTLRKVEISSGVQTSLVAGTVPSGVFYANSKLYGTTSSNRLATYDTDTGLDSSIYSGAPLNTPAGLVIKGTTAYVCNTGASEIVKITNI